jgi:uncharacterized membrane protein YhaH (DUF805 family)
MNYDTLFVNPNGRTSRAQYVPAMATVLAVTAFYAFVVTGRMAQFCLVVLLYPVCVLLARRLRDMGLPAWLPLIPAALLLAAYAIQLGYLSLGDAINGILPWVAFATGAAFLAWGSSGRSES